MKNAEYFWDALDGTTLRIRPTCDSPHFEEPFIFDASMESVQRLREFLLSASTNLFELKCEPKQPMPLSYFYGYCITNTYTFSKVLKRRGMILGHVLCNRV